MICYNIYLQLILYISYYLYTYIYAARVCARHAPYIRHDVISFRSRDVETDTFSVLAFRIYWHIIQMKQRLSLK